MSAATTLLNPFNAENPEFSGEWQALVFTPDLASHQGYVVGVIAQAAGKLRAFRLLQDFSKLECIYGDGVAANVSYLFDRARLALAAAMTTPAAVPSINSVSPHFTLTPPLYISGISAESAANDMYLQVVALEPKEKAKRKSQFNMRDTGTVRASVHNLLRLRLDLEFDQYIKPIGMSIRHEDRDVELNVDVFSQAKSLCASITSGWYAGRERIELHALRALADLHAAREHFQTQKTGLILVRPIDGLPESVLLDIDHFVGDFEARAKEGGILFAAPSTDQEAAEIVEELVRSAV